MGRVPRAGTIAGVMTPEALGLAPDPELARLAASRIGERPAGRALLERPDIVPAAARLLGFSTSAADFFASHPDELEALADPGPRDAPALAAECAIAVDALGPASGLRQFRRRASYRVAARDLEGASLEEIVEELSAIADRCLDVSATVAAGRDLAIVAMGKLGGRELNYASDVDVLFVHAISDGAAHETATRAAHDVIGLLSSPTEDGIALRVDANLRPEGRSGSLARSLPSMLEYYGRHAETWELQALLKARPAAGDRALGEAFVDGVQRSVYPEVLPRAVVDDVRASKARIEQHVRAMGKEHVELKRGRGGIRDV